MNESDVKELFSAAVSRPDVDRIDTDAILRGGRRRRRVRAAAALGSVAAVLACVAALVVAVRPTPEPAPVAPTPVDTTGRAAAYWEFPDGSRPSPEASALFVEVRWVGCASGAAVKDPQPVISYTDTSVALAVWGIPPVGSEFNCPGNPRTTIVVPLREPLGDRIVVPGAAPVTSFPGPTGAAVETLNGLATDTSVRQGGTDRVSGIATLARNGCWYLERGAGRLIPLVWPYGTRWVPVPEHLVVPSGDEIRSGDPISGTGAFVNDVPSANPELAVGPPCFVGEQISYVVAGADVRRG